MSDIRYNLGPNVTYRLLTTDEDMDIMWSVTGFDKANASSPAGGDDGYNFDWWQEKTQRFENYFVTGTTTEHDEKDMMEYTRLLRDGGPVFTPMYATLILIEINGAPAAVLGSHWHYVTSVNGTNQVVTGMLPFEGKEDCWNKWVGATIIRGLHPDFRGYGLFEMMNRLGNEFYTGVNGHDFCNIGLDRSNHLMVWISGTNYPTYEPIQPTDHNSDFYNKLVALDADHASKPEHYELIKLPEYYGDVNCYVYKTPSSNVKWVKIPLHNKVVSWWIVAPDSWGENCRQIVNLQFSGQMCSYDWSKYTEIPDTNGDLSREVVDWSKLSYDTSDNKLYINTPGYDILTYLRVNAPNVATLTNIDTILDKWKNI